MILIEGLFAVSESGRRGWGHVVGTKGGGEYWGFGKGGSQGCAEGYGGCLSSYVL